MPDYDALTPTSLPCPPWCQLDVGHPLDPDPGNPLNPVEYTRFHKRAFIDLGKGSVSVSQFEIALTPDGPCTSDLSNDDVRVTLLHGDEMEDMTGEQARTLARALLAAAELCDSIRAT